MAKFKSKSINKNKLANAFYNEDWNYFKKVYGKKPKNHLEAEQLMNEPKEAVYDEVVGYGRHRIN